MESRRNRILTTAEDAFLEHGFDGTSIDQIVDRAGGSKATVYAHFKDKGVLFATALADIQKGIGFALPHFREQAPADAREGLVLLAVELMTALYSKRSLHLLRLVVSESQRFPEVARQYYEEGPALSIREIARWIAECREAGDHDLPDPDEGSLRLFALLRGADEFRVLLGLDPLPTPETIAARSTAAVRALLEPWESRHTDGP